MESCQVQHAHSTSVPLELNLERSNDPLSRVRTAENVPLKFIILGILQLLVELAVHHVIAVLVVDLLDVAILIALLLHDGLLHRDCPGGRVRLLFLLKVIILTRHVGGD